MENKKKDKEKIHSNKIRQILQETGMSQQELADLSLDGNAAHLSRIPIAIKISRVLKKPVEEVFIYKPLTI